MSPTVFRERGYQFIIYTHDHEPPHAHVRSAGKVMRIRLDTLEILSNYGYMPAQVRTIVTLANEHRDELLQAWRELHGE